MNMMKTNVSYYAIRATQVTANYLIVGRVLQVRLHNNVMIHLTEHQRNGCTDICNQASWSPSYRHKFVSEVMRFPEHCLLDLFFLVR